MWDSLATDFPGIPVIRRGFGGSQIEDVIRCAQRIILPYHPRLAVLYAGDNDLASGKTPERVADDFKALADTILSHLPRTRFVFISIKPSPARWHLIHAVRTTNGLIESVCRINPRLAFADVSTPMLGPNGRPRPELFTPDSLHINRAGYRLWKSVIDPLMRLP
jgi:lysophospholipase L1-like esterase